jgi:hypothetical protein
VGTTILASTRATPRTKADCNARARSVTGAQTLRRTSPADECGAVAQLGERRDGIAKVWGSIPHGSTISQPFGRMSLSTVRQGDRERLDWEG